MQNLNESSMDDKVFHYLESVKLATYSHDNVQENQIASTSMCGRTTGLSDNSGSIYIPSSGDLSKKSSDDAMSSIIMPMPKLTVS